MNYYAFSAFFIFFSSVFCAAIVIWKNPSGEKNLAFLWLAIIVAGWALFYAFWQMSTTYDQALFYIRICIAFAVFIPLANFHALLKILDLETPRRKKFEIILITVNLITLLSAPTKYFIPRVEPKLDFPFWPVPGPFMHIHFINLLIPSFWTLYLIREKGSKASPLTRNKMKWVLIGHLIGYAGGCTNNPLWYNIPLKPYLSILSPFVLFGLVTVFFRAAFIEVNYFLKRALAHLLAFASTALLVWVVLFPFSSKLPFLPVSTLAVLLAILIHPLSKKLAEAAAQRMTKGTQFTAKEIHTRRERIKESSYTYQDLAKNLVNLTVTTFPVETAAVYFFDPTRKIFILSAQQGMKNPLVKDLLYNRSSLAISPEDPIVAHTESLGDLVNMEAFLNESDDHSVQPYIESMNRLEAEVLAPLMFSGKARGFYTVGRMRSNRLFDEEELYTLRTFAQMGTEIMRYIISMETELNHMALYSHDMNHDIRSLMQTLQFLQSPLAENASKERTKTLLVNAEKVAENLFDSFQNSRDRSVLIMKILRGEYEKALINLPSIVDLSAGKFSLQAEKAGVAYVVNTQPTDKVVLGNQLDLTRVVDNLISNAFRYLPAAGGRLEVTGRVTEASYEISVKDNGEGIEPENIDAIWKLGWQGKDTKRGAAGLGLAIVKQIVQIHNGTIQAHSQGKGSGTEFQVVLPLAETEKKTVA